MASQPPVKPDVIDPESPEESPVQPDPNEAPLSRPDETPAPSPDIVEPGQGPSEVPPPD